MTQSIHSGDRTASYDHGSSWGRSGPGRPQLRRATWMLVATLGLVVFGLGLGRAWTASVPLAVAAATVAVICLLPRQADRGWVATALAVTGFLEGVGAAVDAPSLTGPIVVASLAGLQAVAAWCALLLADDGEPRAGGRRDEETSYTAQMAEAYFAYLAQYQELAGEQFTPTHGEAMGSASARAAMPGQSADLHGRYRQDVRTAQAVPDASWTDLRRAAPQLVDPGLPTADQGVSDTVARSLRPDGARSVPGVDTDPGS